MRENELLQYKKMIQDINNKIFNGGTIDLAEAHSMVCMLETLVAEVEQLSRANLSVISLVGNMMRGQNGISSR